MCRLAAYVGPEIPLGQLLHEGSNSLYSQSWSCQELQGTTLNADGFGFGWHHENGNAAIYTSTLPIWSDANLPDLEQTLVHSHWLAYVRSATPGQAVNQANTQPFRHENLLFMHNGRIDEFNDGPRENFHRILSPGIAAGIEGNTDSEYLFAVFRQHYAESADLEKALRASCETVSGMTLPGAALINMLVSDGNSILACRHACNGGTCPSLYVSDKLTALENATLIASEPFSDRESWQKVEEHSIVRLDNHGKLTLASL